jgi:hypothetical protein
LIEDAMTLARWLVSISLLGAVACDTEDPTRVVADNDYPVLPDGSDPALEMTVFKVWWVTSLLPDPVLAGGEGQPQRTVPGTDFAYAVLAPGWDPSSPTPPSRFVAVKSATTLSASRGDTLHVHVSDDAFVGNCTAGKPLSQEDADFITQRIFPGEFSGKTYNAATCAASLTVGDAGDAADAADAVERGDVGPE